MRCRPVPPSEPVDAPSPVPGEVYIEYMALGRQLRAVAVDAASGVEVSVFGPSGVDPHDLGEVAVRKLARRLARLGER